MSNEQFAKGKKRGKEGESCFTVWPTCFCLFILFTWTDEDDRENSFFSYDDDDG
jgi:hypothetical protein